MPIVPLPVFGEPAMARTDCRGALPASAGICLKPEHVRDLLETSPPIGFLEVHAENYMGGGPAPRALDVVKEPGHQVSRAAAVKELQ